MEVTPIPYMEPDNQTNSVNTILLDTNFVLNSLWHSNERSLLQILVNNGIKICTTFTLSREINKVLKNSTRDIDEQSVQLLSKNLTFLTDNDPDVISESRRINIHAPDNIHIATAKVNGASMISSDSEMIRVATDAGVPCYRPDNLVLFYMKRLFLKSRPISKPAERKNGVISMRNLSELTGMPIT